MKKQKQKKIELKKIQVAKLDSYSSKLLKGGSFFMCGNNNTGSLRTKIGAGIDAWCEKTLTCPPSVGAGECHESVRGKC